MWVDGGMVDWSGGGVWVAFGFLLFLMLSQSSVFTDSRAEVLERLLFLSKSVQEILSLEVKW